MIYYLTALINGFFNSINRMTNVRAGKLFGTANGALMKNPNRVYSREQLLNLVWGYEYTGEYRTVDVHIRRLREKVEQDPAHPAHLCTKWGVGYYFKEA